MVLLHAVAVEDIPSTNKPELGANLTPLEKVETPAEPIVTALPTLNSPEKVETPAVTTNPPAVTLTPVLAVIRPTESISDTS